MESITILTSLIVMMVGAGFAIAVPIWLRRRRVAKNRTGKAVVGR